MGLDKFLIGFPIAIMLFAIFIASSTASALSAASGKTVQFCQEGADCTSGTQVQTFAFGSVTTKSFIDMLAVAVGIAVIAGFSITGIIGGGENTEAVHILFILSLLLGVWGILSLAEGFISPTPSPASVFSSLNSAISGLGTTIYLILTLIYMIGGVGAVSRGGTS